MTNYYFLCVRLPEIQLGIKPELSDAELTYLLETNLSSSHLDLLEQIKEKSGSVKNPFLKEWFRFERESILIFAALRAQKYGLSLPLECVDLEDDYGEVKAIYDAFSDDPMNLERAYLKLKFDKIGSLLGLQRFTIDWILAYFMRWNLVKTWETII